MKYSESWLREWVNPNLTIEQLSNMLTMAGLEVEEIAPATEAFTGIVIGHVLKVEKHPESDQLHICQVKVDKKSTSLQIVCGAPNVKVGMNAPVAMVNAVLPNNTIVTKTSIRGALSEGMLCSSSELGLSEESDVLLELPTDAPIGSNLWDYLELTDSIIDVGLTPNRGDCLSIRGLAREISAITNSPLKEINIPEIKTSIKDTFPVTLQVKALCPHYVGRVIRNVKANLPTPMWMKERLRRCDIRSINAVVDVANYVMLELGQPMHAFDLNTLNEGIFVRESKKGERILLLDGNEKELDERTLIIADQINPLAIAGVMGGLDSSVTLTTRNIFLESAYFSPSTVARERQHYELNSDSAYRFERGVDPTIQRQAISRATELILEIVGGEAGPIVEEISTEDLPPPVAVKLTKEKINAVLGMDIPNDEIETIFDRLHFSQKKSRFSLQKKEEWEVHIPPYRFDISLPEDLIEEVARLYGYNKIPVNQINAPLKAHEVDEMSQDLHALRLALNHQGYHEIVSYSFIDNKLQNLLDPEKTALKLLNPITADMTVMRTNLWSGLVNSLLYNKSRQQHRIRLFEIGTCFVTLEDKLLQQPKLAGLITGLVYPEQWGVEAKEADFYDLKGDVENILNFYFLGNELLFKPETHPALHPGQTAGIYHRGQKLGIIGALHPTILQALDLSSRVLVFELDLNYLYKSDLHQYQTISKFPEIRRDIAIIVNQAIPAKEIQDTIKMIAGDWLKEVFVFDVYQGKGISPGLKSIALALILQHPMRTLVDDEVAALMDRLITTLKGQLGAELRS